MAATSGRANIVILLSDDHCYRALGSTGESVVKTPNLDRLASEGVRFTHCFTPMPQCSPSRAAIFTGQDCWTNGVRNGTTPFASDAILWPRLLADAGYEVFFTGKWHNFGMPWDYGFTCGADVYAGGMSDHRRLPLLQWKESKDERRVATKHSSTVFADAAIEFLKTRDASRPFCLYAAFTAPHDPWVPPAAYASIYSGAPMPLPPNFMPRPPFAVPENFAELRDQRVIPFPRTEYDVREALALYYGMITHLDFELGRILTALDKSGLADNTLVVFAGDNGYSLGSHGFVGKQCMYEEGIRIPLIARFPKASRAEPANASLVSLVDIFPTICDVAGVETPTTVEGRSLMPLYRGDQVAWREQIFASHHSPNKHGMSTQCVRTQQYKLIEHRLTGEFELFDLVEDPYELTNLIGNRSNEKVKSRLRAKLSQWGEDHRDP